MIILSSHDAALFNTKLIDTVFMIKNHKLYQKNISDYDYSFYLVKTIEKIKNTKYEYNIENDYYCFKIFNNDLINFLKFLSDFCVLEMIKLEYNDPHYLKGVYDD